MKSQDMLDYTLGLLDDSDRSAVDLEIAADPELAEKVDRLGRAISLLADDGEDFEPPAGLTTRTVTFVAENRRRRSLIDFVPVSVPFRWTDVAVAASIFLAGLLTLLPAAQRSKERMDQAGCGFNLQQLGLALSQYATIHQRYPYPPPDAPNAHAGTFAVILHHAGLLPDLSVLDCPCNGACRHDGPLPDFHAIATLRRKDPKSYRQMLRWDYAYHIGYRNAQGGHGPIPGSAFSANVPLLADQPAHENSHRILEGNSLNHGGRGQNVLFSDGHVDWYNSRRLGPHDEDMFLNANHEAAPGVNALDATLLPSLFPFAGL